MTAFVKVVATGPMLDGRVMRNVVDAIDAAEVEITKQTAAHLRDDLGVPPFKNPTGAYRSHIASRRAGSFHVIHDSGSIYGPWLAGVGSRNWPKTRFKGYAHWRRAVNFGERIGRAIAERYVRRAIGGS